MEYFIKNYAEDPEVWKSPYLTDLHCKQRVLERARQLAAREPRQIAALCFRAGIGRDLGRDLREVFTASQARDNSFGRHSRRVVLPFRNGDQDMASVPLLGRLEPRLLFVVRLAQLRVGYRHLLGNVGQCELDVLEIDRFGGLVARLVVLVARRDRRVVDRDIRAERFDVEQRVSDFTLLIQ